MRIVAISMVVMIHCSGWFALKGGEVCWKEYTLDTLLFGMISSCAVPLFFMISGALLLSESYEFSIRKLLWKLLKIIVLYSVWSAVFALVRMDHFSFEKLVIWTFKGPFHFWFFDYLIGVYLLLPILRSLVFFQEGKYIGWTLICWLVFGILVFSINGVPFHSEEIHIVTGKSTYELTSFSGYFLLGYYLRKRKAKISSWILLFCFVLTIILRIIESKFFPLSVSTSSFTLLVVLQSTIVFLLVQNVFSGRQESCESINHLLSCSAMGVFIIHPFVLEHFTPEFVWNAFPWLRVMTLWLYVMIISYLASYALGKIPGFKKWLLTV